VVVAVGIVVVGWLTFAPSRGEAPASPPRAESGALRKPQMSDTIQANVYADNWFMLYINGEPVAVDSIKFIPHNVVTVDLLPSYPMTIAVIAKDNADPKTGMEYANTHIGDGGFILKFADGTVTDGSWKAKSFSRGPIDRDVKHPRVEEDPLPPNWYAVDFDDSGWDRAHEYTEARVKPKPPFYGHDFKGAKFIWTADLDIDNTVLFRTMVKSPPNGKTWTDFSHINDVVPDDPQKPPRE
jgi:hypothetical protein